MLEQPLALPIEDGLAVDYLHLLAPGQEEQLRGAQAGLPTNGMSLQESLSTSPATLATLLG